MRDRQWFVTNVTIDDLAKLKWFMQLRYVNVGVVTAGQVGHNSSKYN